VALASLTIESVPLFFPDCLRITGSQKIIQDAPKETVTEAPFPFEDGGWLHVLGERGPNRDQEVLTCVPDCAAFPTSRINRIVVLSYAAVLQQAQTRDDLAGKYLYTVSSVRVLKQMCG